MDTGTSNFEGLVCVFVDFFFFLQVGQFISVQLLVSYELYMIFGHVQ